MERAGATPLSSGPPAEGGPPALMDQSLAKRPRPPSEAEQVRARDPGRTTRPVAQATPPTAAMLASPMGDSRRVTASCGQDRRSNGHALWQRPFSHWPGPRRLGGAAHGWVALMGTTH